MLPPKIKLAGMKSGGAFSMYRKANFLGHDRMRESWEWDRYVLPVICWARRFWGRWEAVCTGGTGASIVAIIDGLLLKGENEHAARNRRRVRGGWE
jgi:hypothetical protein